MIVPDASAVIELLLRTPAGLAIESRLFASGETVHAPHLLDIEVAHVIRRYVMRDALDEARGRLILDRFTDLRIWRYPHASFLPRIWILRANLTAYDAAYVALAESLDAVLVTRDKRLAGAAAHTARIELI